MRCIFNKHHLWKILEDMTLFFLVWRLVILIILQFFWRGLSYSWCPDHQGYKKYIHKLFWVRIFFPGRFEYINKKNTACRVIVNIIAIWKRGIKYGRSKSYWKIWLNLLLEEKFTFKFKLQWLPLDNGLVLIST